MELLVVMAIISIISGITYVNISSYKKIENKIDYNNTSILIISFMNNAKLRCRASRTGGYLLFDEEKSIIQFKAGFDTLLDEFVFPSGFKIASINLANNKLSINSLGYSYSAGTLVYKDREGNQHTITMTVGQDYAEIKN